MSHTNSTTNYALPQFLTGDKPAWLTDINNAFSDIDTAVYNAKSAADSAQNDATQALSDAAGASTAASAADAKGAGALASIESAFDPTSVYSVGAKVMYNSLLYRCTVAITTPGPWSGSANWERITVDGLIDANTSAISSQGGAITTLQTAVAGKQKQLYVRQIGIVNASGTAWTPHYYCDYNISSYLPAGFEILGIIPGAQTSGGVLQVLYQGNGIVRLLNDQMFTNITCNINVLYYVPD